MLVLAAGDGERLQALTRDDAGRTVPKQYCSLRGGRSLLGSALDRARRLAPRERIVTVVAQGHRRWWERELADWPIENVVVQPRNRGTAAGVLLPLRTILARDPGAVVGVLPSDHFIADEETFAAALGEALGVADDDQAGHLVLLGVQAERPEADLGWILPGAGAAARPRTVDVFVEKPPSDEAARLMRSGALLNSFAFAVRARVLLALLRRRLPELVLRFDRARPETSSASALAELYATLPEADFSRSVLAGLADALRVVAVPRCGWMDVGTPERIARCLADLAAVTGGAGSVEATLSLAAVLERVTAAAHGAPQPAAPRHRTRGAAVPRFELR